MGLSSGSSGTSASSEAIRSSWLCGDRYRRSRLRLHLHCACALLHRFQVEGKRSVHQMRPLHERHLQYQQGDRDGEMDHVRVVRRQGPVHEPENVHQDTGESREKQEDQEHPVRVVGVLVYLLLLSDAPDDRIAAHIEQDECDGVSQVTQLGELRTVYLELLQKEHDEDKHCDVGGDENKKLQPETSSITLRA